MTDDPVLAIALRVEDPAEDRIRGAWRALEERMGIRHIAHESYRPHITLAAGHGGDPEGLRAAMAAAGGAPFDVDPLGLGAFLMDAPSVHLRWSVSPAMAALRQTALDAVAAACPRGHRFHAGLDWQARSTLFAFDCSYDALADALSVLRDRGDWPGFSARRVDIVEVTSDAETALFTVDL